MDGNGLGGPGSDLEGALRGGKRGPERVVLCGTWAVVELVSCVGEWEGGAAVLDECEGVGDWEILAMGVGVGVEATERFPSKGLSFGLSIWDEYRLA